MEEVKSNISLQKDDGTSIKFNFKLENGLPYKKIIQPHFTIVQSNKTEEFGIYMTVSNNDLLLISDFEVLNYQKFENNDLWIFLNNCYIVLNNLSDTIIKELNNNNLVFCFFNENKKFLNGFKVE